MNNFTLKEIERYFLEKAEIGEGSYLLPIEYNSLFNEVIVKIDCADHEGIVGETIHYCSKWDDSKSFITNLKNLVKSKTIIKY